MTRNTITIRLIFNHHTDLRNSGSDPNNLVPDPTYMVPTHFQCGAGGHIWRGISIWEVVFIQDMFPQVCEKKFLVIYHKAHHLSLEVICCVLHGHLKSPPYAVIQTLVVLFNLENI